MSLLDAQTWAYFYRRYMLFDPESTLYETQLKLSNVLQRYMMRDRTKLQEVTRAQFGVMYRQVYPDELEKEVDLMWTRFITTAHQFDMVAVLTPETEKAPASDPAWGEESL